MKDAVPMVQLTKPGAMIELIIDSRLLRCGEYLNAVSLRMIRAMMSLLLVGINSLVVAQTVPSPSFPNLLPWWKIVENVRNSSVPVVARDTSQVPVHVKYGSAVLFMAPNGRRLAITCAHVVLLRDEFGRKISILPDVRIRVNDVDTLSAPIPVSVEHVDDKCDFAILAIADSFQLDRDSRGFVYKLLTVAQSLTSQEIHEGEPVLYVGYPMLVGIEAENAPVSRMGIVSQIRKGLSEFLIDGFVQKGSSGSPVFLVRSDDRYLIGIARAYKEDAGVVTVNSGLTYVTAMDAVLQAIKEKYCVRSDSIESK